MGTVDPAKYRDINMPKSRKETMLINSEDITLEALLETPFDSTRPPCVLMCHPNPRQGGSIYNNVLDSSSNSLLQEGIASLRFNFRGVGASTGVFGDGTFEGIDTLSVIDFTSRLDQIDGGRLGILGYSFGAGIALEAALATSKVKSVTSIACPQRRFSTFGTVEIVQPKLLICGDHDHDFPLGQFRFLSRRFTNPYQVEIISGADHFFKGYEKLLGDLVGKFFQETL